METNVTASAQAGKRKRKEKLRQKKKPRHLFRRILVIFLIVLVLGGALWYLISSLRSEYTVTYQPYTASIGTISNSLSFNGTMQAVHSATYTASSAGTVRAVFSAVGAQVHEGDKLIRLSTGQIVEAEFDGTVDVLGWNVGDTVAEGDTLCQVVDFNHMKISIRVDEYDINSVHIGDAVRVTTVANEKEFASSIAAINHISSSSGTVAYYTATAYVDVDREVYPGMQATVTLPQEEANNVVILKMDAISFDEANSAFVYTKDEKGNMQQTYITTGVSNGSYTEIRTGLQDGETVYVEVKAEAQSTVSGLFSALFGGSRVMEPPSFGSGAPGGFGGDFHPNSFPGGFSGGSGGPGGGFGGGGR